MIARVFVRRLEPARRRLDTPTERKLAGAAPPSGDESWSCLRHAGHPR